MVVQNADQAVQNAKQYKHCDVGMCLKYTRTWLGIPSREASAIDAWNAAQHKHKGDQKPPRGAPVFWRGGQYGHIALAVNNDHGRSTDTPSSGLVNTEEGNWWRNNWGFEYLGWTEDLNGVMIPYLKDGGDKADWRASGEVYVAKLHKGKTDSDSVARLRYRLYNHPDLKGSGHRPDKENGDNYNADLVDAVRYWQRQVAPKVNGPDDGESMSNPQANRLFGDNYKVIEK